MARAAISRPPRRSRHAACVPARPQPRREPRSGRCDPPVGARRPLHDAPRRARGRPRRARRRRERIGEAAQDLREVAPHPRQGHGRPGRRDPGGPEGAAEAREGGRRGRGAHGRRAGRAGRRRRRRPALHRGRGRACRIAAVEGPADPEDRQAPGRRELALPGVRGPDDVLRPPGAPVRRVHARRPRRRGTRPRGRRRRRRRGRRLGMRADPVRPSAPQPAARRGVHREHPRAGRPDDVHGLLDRARGRSVDGPARAARRPHRHVPRLHAALEHRVLDPVPAGRERRLHERALRRHARRRRVVHRGLGRADTGVPRRGDRDRHGVRRRGEDGHDPPADGLRDHSRSTR